MQLVNEAYAADIERSSRNPVLVAEIRWRNDAGVLYVPTQKVDGLPSSSVQHQARIAVGGVSAASQRIDIDTGASSIGSGTLKVVDKNGSFSEALRAILDDGTDIRHASVTVWQGSSRLEWENFERLWTLIVGDVTPANGGYTLSLRDPNRFTNVTIMTPQTGTVTYLNESRPNEISFGCDSRRYNPEEIDVAGWTYPSDSIVFAGEYRKLLKVGEEIFGVAGITPALNAIGEQRQIDGAWLWNTVAIERRALGSPAEDIEINASATACDDYPEWEEIPYVNARPGDLIALLYTGWPIDGSGSPLPKHWHAGMERRWLDLDSLTALQNQLPTSFRMQKPPGEVTAKEWVERQILGPLRWQMITQPDGRLSLRQAGVSGPKSGATVKLTRDDLSRNSTIFYKNNKISTLLTIYHGYNVGTDRYTVTDTQINPDFDYRHGQPDGPRKIKLESLLPGAGSASVVAALIARHLQWHAQPPTVLKTSTRGSLHLLEVTDTVHVEVKGEGKPSPLRDYRDGVPTDVDRTFEIQSWQHNSISNTLALTLIGGGDPVEVVAPDNRTDIPASALIGRGQPWPLPSVLPSGVSSIAAGTYWIDGNITIPENATLALIGRGSLRIFYTGELSIYGQVITTGKGAFAGQIGAIGRTMSTGGVDRHTRYQCNDDKAVFDRLVFHEYLSRVGVSTSATMVNLSGIAPVYVDGVLSGIPDDLSGAGGAKGGPYRERSSGRCAGDADYSTVSEGGNGGSGGGGLITVGPSLALGPQARVNTSGVDGSAPATPQAGAGAGGFPGGWAHIPTSTASVPPISPYTDALRGGTPDTSAALTSVATRSYGDPINKHSFYEGFSAADMASEVARVIYITAG